MRGTPKTSTADWGSSRANAPYSRATAATARLTRTELRAVSFVGGGGSGRQALCDSCRHTGRFLETSAHRVRGAGSTGPSAGRARPVDAIAEPAKAGLGGVVAEDAAEGVLEHAPRRVTEADGGRAVAAQAGAHEHRVVRRDRALHAGRQQTRQGMLGQRGHDAEEHVARGCHVADDAARDDLGEQRGVLDGAHAVPQAVGVQHVERAAHGGRPGDLTGVRRGLEPALAGEGERPREQLRWVPVLAAPQADADHAALAVLYRPAHQVLGDLHGKVACDVWGEADVDAVDLSCLVGAATVSVSYTHLRA